MSFPSRADTARWRFLAFLLWPSLVPPAHHQADLFTWLLCTRPSVGHFARPLTLDAGTEYLSRHRTCAELRFGAEPAEFVYRPPNRIVGAVPDHGASQRTGPAPALCSPDPGTDRVAMHDEVLRGLLDAPSS